MSRLPLAAAAIVALVVARLLPAEGLGLWVRLGTATLVLFVPGALSARAIGRGGAAAALVWSLAALAMALGVVFVLHTSLEVALLILAGLTVVAVPFALRREPTLHPPGWGLVALAGTAFGLAVWRVSQPPAGDALFHLARVRKLLSFDDLSLQRVTEFADGGLHPGYAFPLWHGFLGLVARLADVDPALVVRYEPSVLAPLAFLIAFEAGVALFRSAWLGAAVVAAQVALAGLAAGNGGAFRSLSLPATAGGRLLLAPAALALVFVFLTDPSVRSFAAVAAAGLIVALVHPTYAVFLVLALLGFAVARALLAARDLVRPALALGGFGLPAGVVGLSLLPLASDVVSHRPSASVLMGNEHGFAHYPGQIEVFSAERYRLAPEVVSRGGAVAVAALCAIPLAGLAARRRWAAFVLGGSVALLAALLLPWLFPRLVDAVSLSQARRAAGFLPFAFAIAGGAAVLARVGGLVLVPAALAAGIALERTYPGDFGYFLQDGGPALATWIGFVGGAVALAVGVLIARRVLLERDGAIAALAVLALVVPVGVDAADEWRRPPLQDDGLSRGIVAALRSRALPGDVVFSDPVTSYRLAAAAPVYLAVSEPPHVADTPANRPYARERDAELFFRTGDLAIPRRYDADWLVIDRRRERLRVGRFRVYSDGRFSLYRLRASTHSR